jgi:hypothetical protein
MLVVVVTESTAAVNRMALVQPFTLLYLHFFHLVIRRGSHCRSFIYLLV